MVSVGNTLILVLICCTCSPIQTNNHWSKHFCVLCTGYNAERETAGTEEDKERLETRGRKDRVAGQRDDAIYPISESIVHSFIKAM